MTTFRKEVCTNVSTLIADYVAHRSEKNGVQKVKNKPEGFLVAAVSKAMLNRSPEEITLFDLIFVKLAYRASWAEALHRYQHKALAAGPMEVDKVLLDKTHDHIRENMKRLLPSLNIPIMARRAAKYQLDKIGVINLNIVLNAFELHGIGKRRMATLLTLLEGKPNEAKDYLAKASIRKPEPKKLDNKPRPVPMKLTPSKEQQAKIDKILAENRVEMEAAFLKNQEALKAKISKVLMEA